MEEPIEELEPIVVRSGQALDVTINKNTHDVIHIPHNDDALEIIRFAPKTESE